MNDLSTVYGPGLHTMPAEEYHRDPCPVPSLSSSIGRTIIAASPLHAWTAHPRLNRHYAAEEKESFDLGSAAHALLLEGADRMVVIDADSYRTKEAKAARDDARSRGLHPVLATKHADVKAMAQRAHDAIARCPDLGGLTLADGKAEQVAIWREDEAWMRARFDWISTDRRVILDYKTTGASASPAAGVMSTWRWRTSGTPCCCARTRPMPRSFELSTKVSTPRPPSSSSMVTLTVYSPRDE